MTKSSDSSVGILLTGVQEKSSFLLHLLTLRELPHRFCVCSWSQQPPEVLAGLHVQFWLVFVGVHYISLPSSCKSVAQKEMNVAWFTVLKNVLYPLALMITFSCSRNRKYSVESDTCSAHLFPCLLSHLSCGFPLDLTNTVLQVFYCRDWAYKHHVSDRNLGLMYILWDLGKRFRARFQDSAVHFLSAGSRCSTEFLAAWMHSCTARDKMLGCGCQQTCLRKLLMSTSQTSGGFEGKAVHYLDCISGRKGREAVQ